MKIDYSFLNDDYFPYLYDCNDKDIVISFKRTFQTLVNLLVKKLRPPYRLAIKDRNEYDTVSKVAWQDNIDTSFCLEFLIMGSNGQALVTFVDDEVILRFANEEFRLQIDFNSYQAMVHIISYTHFLPDRHIHQSLSNSYYTVDVKIGDKTFTLRTPYQTAEFLDWQLFQKLRHTSTINDLRKIYRELFYPYQTLYEQNEDTTLKISQQYEEQEIEIDTITLKKGFIKDYTLGSYQNGTLVSLSGTSKGDYQLQVKNYNPSCNVDNVAQALYARSRKMNIF